MLSADLIKSFVDMTNDKKEENKDIYVYGTVKVSNETLTVRMDGASIDTPVSSMVSVKDGDRVMVMIKDHSAIITGNVSDKSASSETVEIIQNDVEEVIDEIEDIKEDVKKASDSIVTIEQDIVEVTDKIDKESIEVTGLVNRVKTVEDTNEQYASRFETVEEVVATKADGITVDGLRTTINEVKQTADANTTSISTLTETTEGIRTTVNEVKQTADANTASIKTVEGVVATKADGTTVDGLRTTINEVKQTADANTTSISSIVEANESFSTKLNTVEQTANGNTNTIASLESAIATKADGSTVSALMTTVNSIKNTADSNTSKIEQKRSIVDFTTGGGADSGGNPGYIRFAKIEIKQTYCNKPISFMLASRNKSNVSQVSLTFTNSSTLDPGIQDFSITGHAPIYIHKSDTSIWHLYYDKTAVGNGSKETYESLNFFNFYNPYTDVKWTWLGEFVPTTGAPTGMIAVTEMAGSNTSAYYEDRFDSVGTLIEQTAENVTIEAHEYADTSQANTKDWVQKQAYLTINSDSIQSIVRKSEEIIGERNFMRNTRDFAGWTSGSKTAPNTSRPTTFSNGVATIAASSTNMWPMGVSNLNVPYIYLRGKTVTFSCEVKGTANEYIRPAMCAYLSTTATGYRTSWKDLPMNPTGGESSFKADGNWQKVYRTYTLTDGWNTSGTSPTDLDKAYFAVGIMCWNTSLSSIQIRKPKCEIGSRATDWAPAREDEIVSEINQTSELISMKANNFEVDSTNFKLSRTGDAKMSSAQANEFKIVPQYEYTSEDDELFETYYDGCLRLYGEDRHGKYESDLQNQHSNNIKMQGYIASNIDDSSMEVSGSRELLGVIDGMEIGTPYHMNVYGDGHIHIATDFPAVSERYPSAGTPFHFGDYFDGDIVLSSKVKGNAVFNTQGIRISPDCIVVKEFAGVGGFPMPSEPVGTVITSTLDATTPYNGFVTNLYEPASDIDVESTADGARVSTYNGQFSAVTYIDLSPGTWIVTATMRLYAVQTIHIVSANINKEKAATNIEFMARHYGSSSDSHRLTETLTKIIKIEPSDCNLSASAPGGAITYRSKLCRVYLNFANTSSGKNAHTVLRNGTCMTATKIL